MVQKLWDFCDVLRDDGLSYGDYLEQLTYLLFLKMADEQHEMLGGDRIVPVEHGWQSLLNRSGADLEAHYSDALAALGAGGEMIDPPALLDRRCELTDSNRASTPLTDTQPPRPPRLRAGSRTVGH